ncbi:hypothetical protein [Methylobrevis pamukkalensis]|uniref:Sulfotransferase family protein n=1 Tax=Methylobrevis pamukkalensis TaxID=1439726 RepID=A0A1E3GWR8_9HYPH|nr:hypothetical protein [Methylobrevis pamukkalensis]ODN68444.1 hypothetical protein A6302_04261 [Methylobrevis pamukkalensis]
MLIGLEKKFIFVANTKTASSSIEQLLDPHAEIAIRRTAFGKHMTLAQIESRFAWIGDHLPFGRFLVFGVIRDPAHFLLSLYNFHTKDGFDGKPLSTKGVAFEAFVDKALAAPTGRVRPQADRLSNPNGRLRLTHLIRLPDLAAEMRAIGAFLELDERDLGNRNVSPVVATVEEFRPDQLERIREVYAADYALLANPPRDPRITALIESD